MQFLSFLRNRQRRLQSNILDGSESTTLERDLQSLARNTFSSFESDHQRLLSDGRSTLKRLSRSLFPSNDRAHAKSAFHNLFEVKTKNIDDLERIYDGLSLPQDSDDSFGYSLGEGKRQTIQSLVDLDVGRDVDRMERVAAQSKRLADLDIGNKYLDRPGVGPVLGLIERAQKEVTIDIFQLQNKVVSDALYEKARTSDVVLNIRVAMPDGSEKDSTGFSILGPNILELEKFRQLQERLVEEGKASNINLFVADKKSHPKVLITEREAMIGTLNLTQPVGNDALQAGANFESIRLLQRGEHTPQSLATTRIGDAEERSARLFYQLQSVVNQKSLASSSTLMETGQGQVVAPREIALELLHALRETSEGKGRTFFGILNQPFLLMLDKDLNNNMLAGEMGKFDPTHSGYEFVSSSRRAKTYKGIQDKLFKLIIDNQAQVAVDNRGYIEKIVNPMYEKVGSLIPDFEPTYDGSLETLVRKLGGDGSSGQRIKRLTRELQRYSSDFTTDTARQLLAMTSGNIRLTTATMQHVKSFMVVERDANGGNVRPQSEDVRARSYYMGSSNLGAYSLSLEQGDEAVVNREFGLAFSLRKARAISPFALNEEEIKAELDEGLSHFQQQWFKLVNNQMGSESGSKVQSWVESRVHHKGLQEMAQRLEVLSKEVGQGLSVHYLYGGRSGTERIGLDVSIDVRQLAGFKGLDEGGPRFNMRYTVLGGGLDNSPGFVYDLNNGKVIGRTLLQNSLSSSFDTPYGRLDSDNRYQILDPISSAINLISTLAAESLNRTLSWGPQEYIADMTPDQRLGLVLDYVDVQVSGRRGSEVEFPGIHLLHSGPAAIRSLAERIQGLDKTEVSERIQSVLNIRDDSGSKERALNQALGFLELLSTREFSGGRPSTSSADWQLIQSGLGGSLVSLLETDPNFLLDVVRTSKGSGYDKELHQGLRSFKDSLFDPFLYLSDVSKYSGSQGLNRLPIYQVTDDMHVRIGHSALLRHALMVPSNYDPSTDLGINGVWRSIASKSTINQGTDLSSGATLYGRKGSPVGDVMDSRLGVSLGVGFRSTREQVYAIAQGSEKLDWLIEDRLRGQDSGVTYTFDVRGKLASIPQRLKNVIGQQGLVPMTKVAQQILEVERAYLKGEAPLDSIQSLKSQANRMEREALDLMLRKGEASLAGYMQSYTEALRANMLPDARHLVTEDLGLAAIFGGGIRKVLGGPHYQQINELSQRLADLTGEDGEDSPTYYLLQAKAVAADLLATGEKGFTGGRVKTPLVLMQLSGAYSDHFIANPLYGGGVREGFLETKNIQVRANQLAANWHTTTSDGKEALIARAGDLISFDVERNQVLVLNARGLQRRLGIGTDINIDAVREQAREMYSQAKAIDDRSQVSVIEGILDSLSRDGSPSFATKGVSSFASTRQGEDAIDYLLDVRPLAGSNNLNYELVYAHSIMPGGGRRVEGASSGMLFKGVGVFGSEEYFRNLVAAKQNTLGSLERVDVEQVFGLVNAGNFKSFSYSHGAGILRDAVEGGNRLGRLFGGKSSGEVAANLLIHFGSAWVGETVSPDLSKALVEFLGRGEAGDYYKTLVSGLMVQKGGDIVAVGNELLGAKVGKDGVAKSNLDRYNVLQLPSLADLSLSEVLGALQIGGDSGRLAKQVASFVGYEVDIKGGRLTGQGQLNTEVRKGLRYAMDVGNTRHRQSAILLTSLDISSQLSAQGPGQFINPGDLFLGDSPEGNRNLIKVASIMGFDPLRISRGLARDEDLEYTEMVRNVAIGMSGQVASIFLETDLAFSQSKEPSGKKHTGNLEGVQMVRPFLNLASEFTSKGDIGKLKIVIGSLLAGMAVGQTATGLVGEINLQSAYNLFDPLNRPDRSQFLGIYGSGVEDIGRLQQTYRTYEELVAKAIADRTSEITSLSSLIATLGETEAVGIISQRSLLVEEVTRLVLDSDSPEKVKDLLGESYREDFDGLVNRIKEVGQRYDVLSSKPLGVGMSNAIINSMGHAGGVFFLPAIYIEGEKGGQVLARIDETKGAYTFLPGGKDLQLLGSQYGAHVDDVVMASIQLLGAFTPGTSMHKVMQKLQTASMTGNKRALLSVEEAALLEGYQHTFRNMTGMLAQKGAGQMAQRASGGKTTLDGGVTTPAPSWWIPEGTLLLSQETLRKQGLNEGARIQKYADIQDRIASLDPNDTTKRTLLKAYGDTLLNGLSEAGVYLLSQIRRDREQLQSLESQYRQTEDKTVTKSIWERARSLISQNIDEYRGAVPQGLGDVGDGFVVKVGQLEMEYFIQAFGDMDDLSLIKHDRQLAKQQLDTINRQASRLGIQDIETFDLEGYVSRIRDTNRQFISKQVEQVDRSLNALEVIRSRAKKSLQLDYESNAIEHLQRIMRGEASRIGLIENQPVLGQARLVVESPAIKQYLSTLDPELAGKLDRIINKGLEASTFSHSEHIADKALGQQALRDKAANNLQSSFDRADERTARPGQIDNLQSTLDILSEMAERRRQKSQAMKSKVKDYQVKESVLDLIEEEIHKKNVQRQELMNTDPDSWTETKTQEVKQLIHKYQAFKESQSGVLNLESSWNEVRGLLTSEHFGGLSDQEYQGKARGELTTYSFNRKSIKGLGLRGQRTFLSRHIQGLIGDYQSLIGHLARAESGTYEIGEDARRTLLESSTIRTDLQSLVSQLGYIQENIETIGIEESIIKIEGAINQLDASDVVQAITFRNAPFGSTETQRQALSLIQGVEVLNQYIQEQDGTGVQYDTRRNQTMTLLNPLSMLTLNLGDFDGDPYTSIFTRLSRVQAEVRGKRDLITRNQLLINQAVSKALDQDVDYFALTDEQAAALRDIRLDRTDLSERISSLEAQINDLQIELGQATHKVQGAFDVLEKGYGDALRKEVADYLGLDVRSLLGKAKGGYLTEDLHIAILPTLIQQGHGLFPGLKDQALGVDSIGRTLLSISERLYRDNQGPEGINIEAYRQMDGPAFQSHFGIQMEAGFVRDTFLDRAHQILTSGDFTNRVEFKAKVFQTTGAMLNVLQSNAKGVSYLSKAMGATLNDGIQDMLTKVLGKAGGDILGRTYNTLVGTMFADSPLIAISQVLTGDAREAVKKQLAVHYGSKERADTFLQILDLESQRAASLQGFMKNAQQLLRDSIKFKKADDTLTKLQDSLDKYNDPNLDEEGRRSLISHIAGQLGPGPGLKAFMQLESLVSLVGDKRLDTTVESLSTDLSQRITSDFDLPDLHGIVPEMQMARRAFGLDELPSPTVRDVLKYKVGRDLQNLVAANRYNLSLDTGSSLFSTLRAGAEGPLDNLGVPKLPDLDARILTAFSGEDERSQVRQARARQILGADWDKDSQSPDRMLALLGHIEQSISQTSGAFGYAGEALDRMTELRVVGKSLGNLAAGRSDELGIALGNEELIKADILSSMLQLTASNKLDTQAAPQFLSFMGAILDNPDPTSSLLTGLNTLSPLSENQRQIYTVLKDFLASSSASQSIKVGGAVYDEGIVQLLSQQLASTRAGSQNQFIQEFTSSYKDLLTSTRSTLSPEVAGILEEGVKRGAKDVEALTVRNRFTQQEDLDAQAASRAKVAQASANLQNQMDLASGIGIALAASALFSGGLSAESAKEVLAGTIMTIGYNKSGMGTGRKSWLAGLGSSFRVRMAAMDAGPGADTGEWLAKWMIRETLFSIGASAGYQLIDKFRLGEKTVSGVASFFGANPKPLDFDRYASWKGAASTISGAILSALMGSISALVGTKLLAGMDDALPTMGALEQAVRSSVEMQRQADENAALIQTEGLNVYAPDDPLAEYHSISYEISSGIDDRYGADFEDYLSDSNVYSDSDTNDYPELEVGMSA